MQSRKHILLLTFHFLIFSFQSTTKSCQFHFINFWICHFIYTSAVWVWVLSPILLKPYLLDSSHSHQQSSLLLSVGSFQVTATNIATPTYWLRWFSGLTYRINSRLFRLIHMSFYSLACAHLLIPSVGNVLFPLCSALLKPLTFDLNRTSVMKLLQTEVIVLLSIKPKMLDSFLL